jgi:CheY-like chemotaxis protein
MITASDLRLAVMTVRRSPEYVHTSLASLLLSDPLVHELKGLHLIVGSADAEYLNEYRHHRRIEIHPMSPPEAERSRDWIQRRRLCFNYYRCLTIPQAGYEGLCVCEDDIIFQDGFIKKMLAAVNEMEQRHKPTKYLLDLYMAYGRNSEPTSRLGRFCAKYSARAFYGTQCMYYPSSLVPEVAQLIYEHGVEQFRLPSDLLVGEYANETGTLYGTVRSLVDHIGFHSTGVATFFHRASTFHEDFPPLDFSEIVEQKMGFERIRFNLQESLAEPIRILGVRAQQKGLELIFDVREGVPTRVVGYPNCLRHLMNSFVGNVIRFTERGEVVVRIETEIECKDAVWLHFSIIGPGIPQERGKAIFEALAQPDNSTTRQFSGSDVDHRKSLQLVEMMGGRIRIESLGDQNGSTLHFTACLETDTSTACQSTPTSLEHVRGLPVLIVDDNATNRRLLLELLAKWGMEPTAVPSGRAALKILQEPRAPGRSFWLVMLDAEMPEMNGFAVAERMNRNPGLVGTTLMMLTAGISGNPGDRCREVGITDHLVKPILQSELMDAIRYVVSRDRGSNTNSISDRD